MIGAVGDSLIVAAEQGIDALLAKPAEPQAAIVSLTITEKGYCIEPGSGQLDPTHSGIVADLAASHTPATVPSILAEALNLRHQRGLAPFEEMKLRMLNGSHSFLVWLGHHLAGYAHISDCMNDATLRAAVEKLMLDEQAPSLQSIEGVDTGGDYARQLLARFANPALIHRT